MKKIFLSVFFMIMVFSMILFTGCNPGTITETVTETEYIYVEVPPVIPDLTGEWLRMDITFIFYDDYDFQTLVSGVTSDTGYYEIIEGNPYNTVDLYADDGATASYEYWIQEDYPAFHDKTLRMNIGTQASPNWIEYLMIQ